MAQRLVALLRGINVGKNKRLAMADLRQLLSELGYTEIRTHLNSGNVVFSSTARLARRADQRIGSAIASELGVQCSVLTRTDTELAEVLAGDPLAGVATDPARYLVTFLAAELDPKLARSLARRDFGHDQLRLIGRHAYLWCPAGINDSAVAKVDWQQEFGVSATARNWNTVLKLTELAARPS